MITDPIADMLTRIRNASTVGKKEVRIPYSKVKFEIAKLLQANGYLLAVEKTSEIMCEIVAKLSYKPNKQPAITSIKRVSRPGRRVYVKKDELPNVLGGIGIAIISTSHGIMTNKEAKKQRLGGEVMCEIY